MKNQAVGAMRVVFGVSAALVLCAGVAAQAPAPSAPPTPTPAPAPAPSAPAVQLPIMAVGSKIQAVGVVSPLDFVRGSFKIRNVSDKPVTVLKVEAGCRCTYGAMTENTIPPGGESTLNYEIDVRGTIGPLRKPINIRLAGFTEMYEVVVQGELQYPVRCSPPTITPNGVGEAQITLSSADGVPFSVLSVDGQPATVVSRNPAEGPKALTWTLSFNVGRQWPYAVVVETDHPKAPVIDLRVMSAMVSNKEMNYFRNINDIAIGRHMVNLGVVKPGGDATFDFYITRVKDYDKPIELATDGGDIKLSLVETFPWRRPDDTGVRIKAKFKEGMTGTKLFPVYVTSNGKTNRTWACVVLKDGVESAEQPTSKAAK
jgi:hypothetical protein